MTSDRRHSEVAFHIKQKCLDSIRVVMFNLTISVCGTIKTSPLPLREQGARRSLHRLCFSNPVQVFVIPLIEKPLSGLPMALPSTSSSLDYQQYNHFHLKIKHLA